MKQAIKSCPECSSESIEYDGMKRFRCSECAWEFYMNTAAAVAGVLEKDGKFLVVKRNREPGLGLYDLPGGFLDPHETAEQALKREIIEELQVEVGELTYLCTAPNVYQYKGIEYTTCDIFYTTVLKTDSFIIDTSEIASYKWLDKENVNFNDFAFSSIRAALKTYIDKS